MGDYIHSRDWLKQVHRVMELGYTAPNPNSTYVGLLSSGLTLNSGSTLFDVLAGESTYSNSYTRPVFGRLVTAVDTTAETITVPGHGLTADTPITFAHSSGSPPAPFVLATPYWVRNPTTDTFQLATAPSGSPINITGLLSGTLVVRVGSSFDTGSDKREEASFDQTRMSVTGANLIYQGYFILCYATAAPFVVVSNINTSTDEILTATAHGWSSGQEVILTADSGGTQPAGTSPTTLYFARVVTTTSVTLHPTAADATGGTNRVDITSAGSGTLRLRNAKGVLHGFEYYASPISLTSGANFLIQKHTYIANSPNPIGV